MPSSKTKSSVNPLGQSPPPRSSAISAAPVSLNEVIATDLLKQRPKRRADYRAEAEALGHLGQTMATAPEAIFQELVELALKLCGSQSSGISLLETTGERPVFRWRATAGVFAPLVGSTLPRDFSPCGAVLDREALQLMRQPSRHYPYIAEIAPDLEEVLLVPFHAQGAVIGTVWVAAHNPRTQFDAEDARLLTNLSQFASSACQAIERRAVIEDSRKKLRLREHEHAVDRAELALAKKRERLNDTRFHAFFEQAPFYAGMLSTDGRLIDAGREALEPCGYSRDEVIGEYFWETPWWRASPETQQKLHRAFGAALTGESFQAVLPYVFSSGENRWMDFAMSPVFDEDRAVLFVVVTGSDISDRVTTDADLASTRKSLESALLAGEIGTYEWDVDADRLRADRNFTEIFGVHATPDGFASRDEIAQVIHPDDRARVQQSVRRSVETGAEYREDYRVLHRTAGERWIDARGRMTKDHTGRVVNFFGVVIDITLRKHAEAEREIIADRLRRLTAIHETVLSATNDFAYVFDLEGRFVYANRPLLALYGRTLDQVVGKTFSELGYPDWHADMHLNEIARVVATQRPIQGEVPFKGESGISGIYDYIFTPVFGADGKVEAVAGTTRDVTERKRGEDRDRLLIALDDTTRILTDAHAITQASARLLGGFLHVNRCAYADVEPDENTFNLTGDFNRDVPSIVGRYRFDQFGEDCLRQMHAGEPYIVSDAETDPRTDEVRDAYRATRIRAVICVPLRKSGRFVAAMAVHQTEPRQWLQGEVELVQMVASRCWESIERTRVVRELAESEQRLRLAVRTGRLGTWELNVPTKTLVCSDQCRANYGKLPGTPFSYEDLLAIIHPEDRHRMQSAVTRALESGEEFDIEYRILWPDGSTHWVLVRGQFRPAADGKPAQLIGVSLDITARKEAEREQVRLREEAVSASRAKDDFLATLSHELRTPLNPVLLIASDAAQDPGLPADARAAFEMIRQNVELEARLIDDLLDLTTIVRGKLTIKKEARNLHAILSDAIAAVRNDFVEKGIALEIHLRAQRHTVCVDAVRILQVFVNLLKNAVKFTPRDGKVALFTEVVASDSIAVTLTDTGIGMSAQEITRVFKTFEQGDHANESSAHRFGGLGLGLAISQRLAELNGGTITAYSEGRDRGSTFVVNLPLHPETNLPEASWDETPAPSPRQNSPRDGIRILLLEDHEPTRRTLEQLLARRNYQVVAAGSLAEARERMAAERVDFVISDLGLPDGSGTILMRELRDKFGLRGIALTGYGMEEDVARCRAAGFVTHLTKPIRVEALEAALRDALHESL